jgi:hypothetical protein
MFFIAADISPPPEPYNPEADPVMKEALDIMKIANEVIDILLREAIVVNIVVTSHLPICLYSAAGGKVNRQAARTR